ncbi:MAG: PQQ-binding-like beta-propeller repeat protein [Solirubrobacteraceae bacterium]
MAFRHRGNRWLPWVGLAASLLVIAVAAIVVVLSGREGDFSDPNAEFSETQTQATTHEAVQKAPKRGHPADDGFSWPIFGLDNGRTRVLPLKTPFRPPFRIAWKYHAHQLLEFTPVLCKRSVFLLGDNGDLFKISRWTGQVQWRRKLGTLAASSPACDDTGVFAVTLRRPGSNDGNVVALGSDKGHKRWSRRLPARAESSPLLHKGVLYFGTEDGTVYALDADTGRLVWKFRASGAVKGSLALSEGRLFFGTYGGTVYAIGLRDGHQVWSNHVAKGGAFGLSSGNFYSSAAVEYGRVYIGATNGVVYSLSARTGRLAWRQQTGAYVYASPAVGAVAGGKPTVWIGSYNGNLYGLDARSGDERWVRHLGGKLSGSPTVIGDLVFQSSFDRRTTWAVGANTGRVLWSRNRGAFTAAISDGRRIYFNGYGTLYALDPKGRHFARIAAPKGTPAHRREAAKKKRAAKKPAAGKRKQRSKGKAAAKRRAAAAKRKRAAKRRFCRTHKRAKRCR